ncbi:MAG: LacI family DNA-binding transcriptional regulator [Pseudomonadota bacterium]
MKAAEQLGYQPNAIARSLISGRSNTAAVVISTNTALYFPEILVGLNQHLASRGVRALLFTLEQESEIDLLLDQVLQYQVDGMIVAARLSNRQIDAIEQRRVPFVLYNRSFRDRQVNAVCCDQSEGERWLVDALVNAGHQRFGIISGPGDSSVSTERTQGALERLQELGVNRVSVVEGDFGYDSGAAALVKLQSRLGTYPDAVICANDTMALGCIDAARHEHQLAVPQDMSVVGFDGVGPARWSSYNLTTIRQPVDRMAEAAVSMILERVDNPVLQPEKRFFSGEMVAGNSARLDASPRS